LVRWLGKFLLCFTLLYAIFFVGPFTQIDQLAAFATKRASTVVGVPLMFFTAMWAVYDRWGVG